MEGEAERNVRKINGSESGPSSATSVACAALVLALILLTAWSPAPELAQGHSTIADPLVLGATDEGMDTTQEEIERAIDEALSAYISARNEQLCPTVNEESPTLDGPDVVCYGQPYISNVESRYIQHGWPIDHGCAFTSLMPPHGMLAIEVVYDRTGCTRIIEVGVPAFDPTLTFAAPENGSVGSVTSGSSASSDANGFSQDSGDSGSVQSSNLRLWRYSWSWFDEPARWVFDGDVEAGAGDGCLLPPVNAVYHYIDSIPDGTCVVTPGTKAHWERELTWLTLTGWSIVSQSHQNPPPLIHCPTNRLDNLSHVHFRNRGFCASFLGIIFLPILPTVFETHTRYEPNRVTIFASGQRSVGAQVSKSGGCHELLREGGKAPQGTGQNRRFP